MTDWKKKYEDLVRLLNEDGGQNVYMMGHLSKEERASFKATPTDAYKSGWNDCLFANTERLGKIMEGAEDGVSDDVTLLLASGCCFSGEDTKISLNMNDTWAWASSELPDVPDEQIPEVARLFRRYGFAGLMYWYTLQPDGPKRSEFHDNNRAIDFVRHEEEIRKETPNSSKRAYRQLSYVIGVGVSHESKRSWWRFWS